MDYCIYILLTSGPQESALLDTGPLPPIEVDYCIYIYIYITYLWPPRISTTGYWSSITIRGGLLYIYITYHCPPRISTTGYWSSTTIRGGLLYIYITYIWPPRISTTGYWSTTTNRGGLLYIYILLTSGPPESALLDTGPLPPIEVDYCIYIYYLPLPPPPPPRISTTGYWSTTTNRGELMYIYITYHWPPPQNQHYWILVCYHQ